MSLRLSIMLVLACGLAAACRKLTSSDHAGLALVREYAQRDARGEFAGVSKWYDSVTQFGRDVQGWDEGAVVRSYSVSPLYLGADSGVVEVSYDQLAVIGGDGAGGVQITYRDTSYADTFAVRLTQRGWRIVRPILPPHTLADIVAQGPSLTPPQRTQLLAAKDRRH